MPLTQNLEKVLHLQLNGLSGKVPRGLGKLKNLRVINMSSNELGGGAEYDENVYVTSADAAGMENRSLSVTVYLLHEGLPLAWKESRQVRGQGGGGRDTYIPRTAVYVRPNVYFMRYSDRDLQGGAG